MICRECHTDKEPKEFYWKDRKARRKDTTCKRCRIIQQRERTLGVTEEQYRKFASQQNHRCGICRSRLRSKRYERFAVDHCHDTGKLRGLLCNNCNTAIGLLKHDPARILRAVEWVER
jgi:hypothetical protein